MGDGATKGLKEATNNIDDGIKKVGENIKETKAKKIFNTAQELVDDIAKNRYSIRKNIIELTETKQYAKKYFDKFIKEGNFDDWFKNTFAKYDKSTLTFEAHHIIPIDVLKTNPDLRQLLFDLKKADPNFKFDFNGIDNGMMLQKKNLNLDINGHTSHKNYNDAISENISVIIENAPTSKKAFERIQKLIIDTKDKLEKEVLLGTKNVNDIKNF